MPHNQPENDFVLMVSARAAEQVPTAQGITLSALLPRNFRENIFNNVPPMFRNLPDKYITLFSKTKAYPQNNSKLTLTTTLNNSALNGQKPTYAIKTVMC